jgi:hypothetical protein
MSRSLMVLALLAPLSLAGGCANSHGSMMEAADEGVALEEQGRAQERREQFPPAAESFAQSQASLDEALAIAKVRQNHVFISFITTKLAIVSAAQARCVEPKNNPQGSWERAVELYVQSAAYADEVTMTKLKANAVLAQGRCKQPDHDPKGSWEQAGALYAKAAEICEGMEDEKGRGEALRLQALCLLQGDPAAPLTPEARALLVKARKLGDEQAADLLTASGAAATYCKACGADRKPDDKLCPECGRDQSLPAPGESGARGEARGPGSPGSPTDPENPNSLGRNRPR